MAILPAAAHSSSAESAHTKIAASKPMLHFGTNATARLPFTFELTRPSRLESLPAELRLLIYTHLGFCVRATRSRPTSRYRADDVNVRTYYRFLDPHGRHDQRRVQSPFRPYRGCSRPFSTALLRVNRNLRHELYEIMYGESWMSFAFDPSRPLPRPLPASSTPTASSHTLHAAKDATPPLDKLHFDVNIPRFFLSPFALSFLTHVTLGPLPLARPPPVSHTSVRPRFDAAFFPSRSCSKDNSHNTIETTSASRSPFKTSDMQQLVDSIAFISTRCPRLRVLGVHVPDVHDLGRQRNQQSDRTNPHFSRSNLLSRLDTLDAALPPRESLTDIHGQFVADDASYPGRHVAVARWRRALLHFGLDPSDHPLPPNMWLPLNCFSSPSLAFPSTMHTTETAIPSNDRFPIGGGATSFPYMSSGLSTPPYSYLPSPSLPHAVSARPSTAASGFLSSHPLLMPAHHQLPSWPHGMSTPYSMPFSHLPIPAWSSWSPPPAPMTPLHALPLTPLLSPISPSCSNPYDLLVSADRNVQVQRVPVAPTTPLKPLLPDIRGSFWQPQINRSLQQSSGSLIPSYHPAPMSMLSDISLLVHDGTRSPHLGSSPFQALNGPVLAGQATRPRPVSSNVGSGIAVSSGIGIGSGSGVGSGARVEMAAVEAEHDDILEEKEYYEALLNALIRARSRLPALQRVVLGRGDMPRGFVELRDQTNEKPETSTVKALQAESTTHGATHGAIHGAIHGATHGAITGPDKLSRRQQWRLRLCAGLEDAYGVSME